MAAILQLTQEDISAFDLCGHDSDSESAQLIPKNPQASGILQEDLSGEELRDLKREIQTLKQNIQHLKQKQPLKPEQKNNLAIQNPDLAESNTPKRLGT